MSETPKPSNRSTFVTAGAWVFIALAGFATFIALLQNIMIWVMFPADAIREAQNAKALPALARFLIARPQLVFGAFLIV